MKFPGNRNIQTSGNQDVFHPEYLSCYGLPLAMPGGGKKKEKEQQMGRKLIPAAANRLSSFGSRGICPLTGTGPGHLNLHEPHNINNIHKRFHKHRLVSNAVLFQLASISRIKP